MSELVIDESDIQLLNDEGEPMDHKEFEDRLNRLSNISYRYRVVGITEIMRLKGWVDSDLGRIIEGGWDKDQGWFEARFEGTDIDIILPFEDRDCIEQIH